MIKKIFKIIIKIIYKFIPIETKKKINSPLKKILIDKASKESFEYFEKILQNCLLFETTLDLAYCATLIALFNVKFFASKFIFNNLFVCFSKFKNC